MIEKKIKIRRRKKKLMEIVVGSAAKWRPIET